MTYERTPLSIEEGVTYALSVLSPARIEEKTGKGVDVFKKCANPTSKNKLSFADGARLDAALIDAGELAVFEGLFARLRNAQLRSGAHKMGDPYVRLTQATKEVGDVAAAIDKADDDGSISAAEYRLIGKEAAEAVRALEKIVADAKEGEKRCLAGPSGIAAQ